MSDLLELSKEDMLGTIPNDIPKATEHFILAGGSVRKWFLGEEQTSDFDYFLIGDTTVKSIVTDDFKLLYENKVNKTYIYKGHKVQIILLKYSDIPDLIDSFDFCHCCFAYDGTHIYATQEALISSLRKNLRVHKIQKGYELDSLRRAFKYQRAGYTPCLGTIRDLALSFSELKEEDINKMISISPSGGKRKIIRLD